MFSESGYQVMWGRPEINNLTRVAKKALNNEEINFRIPFWLKEISWGEKSLTSNKMKNYFLKGGKLHRILDAQSIYAGDIKITKLNIENKGNIHYYSVFVLG